MTTEQEARLLSNQVLIMKALQPLLRAAGKDFMGSELQVRIADVEAFIALSKDDENE